MKEDINYNKCSINIQNNSLLEFKGITKLTGFDSNEFLFESYLGPVYVTGSDLELAQLNTDEEVIKISGCIKTFSYLDKRSKKESIFSKLFK